MSLIELDFSDSLESSVAPTQGTIQASSLQTYASDAAFEVANGAGQDGDIYTNTTDGNIHYYQSSWKIIIVFTQLSQSLTNNAGPLDVTSLTFNKANTKAAHIALNIERKTDSSNEQESGWLYVFHDSADDIWRSSFNGFGDDSGVTFSITAAGQVQYTTDDLTGTNYSGTLRVGDSKEIDQ